MKKTICTLLILLAPLIAGGQQLHLAKENALSSCSKYNLNHRTMLAVLLKFELEALEFVKQSPEREQEVQAQWEKVYRMVQDKIFELNKKNLDHWVATFVKDKPASSQELWRERAELYANLANVARETAFFGSFLKLRRTQPTEATIERVFIQACENEVHKITRGWVDREERGREASERGLAEVDRLIDQSKKLERAAEISTGERFLNLGMNLMGAGDSAKKSGVGVGPCHYTKDFVSGFHRTCYYQCPTGVVTSTVAAAEICPITRTAP